MANDPTQLYSKRPASDPKQQFAATPEYVVHSPYEDKLAILVCQIKIWEAKDRNWFAKPNYPLIIRECESIEVASSTKDLIGKAVVRFPRGTVISLKQKKNAQVHSGNAEDNTENTSSLSEATNQGEIITPRNATYKDGTPTTSMATRYDLKGLVDFNRHKDDIALLSPNDVAIGNRIEIRCGYAYSEDEYEQMNSEVDNSMLKIVFTGFITSISVSTPLELECANMAHVFACFSAPNIPAQKSLKIRDFLDPDGKYHLLNDTGIPLAPECKNSDINVGGDAISNNLTVADVFAEWSKFGVLCIMETLPNGSTQLRVGYSYDVGLNGIGSTNQSNTFSLPNNDKRYITYNGGNNSLTIIQFDWDVANDKLGLMRNDKAFLAIEATGRTKDNQFFKLTIRKNADNDDDGWMMAKNGNFQIVNRKKVKDRKKAKYVNGTLSTKAVDGKLTDKADMKKYTVVKYTSPTIGITEEELIEEAIQFYNMYNPNGISGSISIFGDIFVKPAEIIGLVDMLQPEKNGYYYVESVNTTFGVEGYRRELKMPLKVASFSKPIEIIR